jgi:polysaccharide export outer membrane protein
MIRGVREALLSVVLLVVAATAGAAQTSRAGGGDGSDRLTSAAAAPIRPGDQVVLRIWREPEMSDTLVVDERGEVVLPRLGLMRVDRQSAAALRDTLRERYAQYLRNPAVDVTVLRRIAVHGEVRRPDLYLVDLTMTLQDVLAKAGGVSEAGSRKKIYIVRGGEQVRLDSHQQASFRATELLSGDQIVVGRRSWFAQNSLPAIGTGMAAVSFIIGVVVPLLR